MDNNNNKVDLTGSAAVDGSAWALMASWLTPKILFCFLNITIATIFISSNFKSRNKRQNDVVDHHYRRLVRSPSLLQRVGSFDFSFFSHNQETIPHVPYAPPSQSPSPQLQRSPSLLDRLKSFDFSVSPAANPEESTHQPDPPQVKRVPSMLERVKSIKLSLYNTHVTDPVSDVVVVADDHHVERRKSAGAGTASRKKSAPEKKMKKSASVKPSATAKAVEDVEERRPATTRPAESASLVDEEVDARADDFINRFRQQLKLQRLDSLLRYRETLNKGPTK